MTEFWEENFIHKKEMWGFEAAKSASLTRDLFAEKGLKKILIPGIGYGRNAQVFIESGMTVNGIEISKTAISMAKAHFKDQLNIHHGSVTAMPFDNNIYDGIFCHALIHLLKQQERAKLIRDCYQQLADNAYMVFTAIAKKDASYGKGKRIAKDFYEMPHGVNLFFYDKNSIQKEFGAFGLYESLPIRENQDFYLIKCQKKG